jgi:GNAT superfamily N-acetyltransferase
MARRLADPGTLLSTTHEVDDGLRVRLRLARPSDAMRMQAFFDGLSDETRHRRFFVAMPHTSETLIRHFTFFDPRERLVVVAAAMIAHSEEIVGVADVALLDTAIVELGVVVDDAQQGMGIGKLLTEAIASLALRQGATHLRAELLEGNERMVALMQRLGRTAVTAEGHTSVAVTRLPAGRRRAA